MPLVKITRKHLEAQLRENLKQQREYVSDGKSARQVFEEMTALKEMGETLKRQLVDAEDDDLMCWGS